MKEEESYPDVFHYLWNLGYILTSIMQISRSNDVRLDFVSTDGACRARIKTFDNKIEFY
ncbi:hypothetical protein LCGC14_1401500 [marine sediment metagenome]|uniref:Uncharacterized protein n=1 Tax=marine sediment metagenome TaxID=412755 RepID=A0A0F9JX05_9ZZZZ